MSFFKTAFVHDWLVNIAGAEKALAEMYAIFPGDVYTLVKNDAAMQGTPFEKACVTTSFIQNLPFASKAFRSFLPLFPMAIEGFDLRQYELVISSSHSVAKGVLTFSHQLHICYCYTPMRYAWDFFHLYLKESKLGALKAKMASLFLHYLRSWDLQASNRVDHFIAISHYIKERIRKNYRRDAAVIYPPVNVDYFELKEDKQDFYLTASRLVPYKRIDLIVQAFAQMPEKKLFVIGDGPERKKIEALAPKNVTVLGYRNNFELKEYLQGAKAFVFAAEEDFGILPVEAQACGTPVIAFGRGGAAETVEPHVSGLLFKQQSVASLCKAIGEFEKMDGFWEAAKVRQSALRFHPSRFRREFSVFVKAKAAEKFGTKEKRCQNEHSLQELQDKTART